MIAFIPALFSSSNIFDAYKEFQDYLFYKDVPAVVIPEHSGLSLSEQNDLATLIRI